MLNFSSHEAYGVLVFTVDEASLGENSLTQREWLYKTIETREDPKFIIDLASITYLASSDIGFLITIKRRVDNRSGKVALANVDPFIADIFKTMRIDKLFIIAENVPKAVQAVCK